MKLWLLDADIIIDFLGLGIFDKLVRAHEVYAADTVIDQVREFKRGGERVRLDLRNDYVKGGLLRELRASLMEIEKILSRLPPLSQESIHTGELESLAILAREDTLTFCSCDAATIRVLPLLDLGDRGVSAERLLKLSGLPKPGIEDRHTEKYFRSNLEIGKEQKILSFKSKEKTRKKSSW